MARRHHTPQQSGWIGIQSFMNKTLAHIDCTKGGAQEVFSDLCRDFKRAGWDVGQRSFDWVFVRRNGVQWEIRIGVLPPGYAHPNPHQRK